MLSKIQYSLKCLDRKVQENREAGKIPARYRHCVCLKPAQGNLPSIGEASEKEAQGSKGHKSGDLLKVYNLCFLPDYGEADGLSKEKLPKEQGFR